ncbi:MAG TPA: PLP-dependent aminotransferase family protein [Thermoanaerobaculia bacterium]|nr:PLP-dependent aminotransferase family protein [Thermoanaerobaculia bacterium]
MPRQPRGALIPALETNFDGDSPLHRQIYGRIRTAVLTGALPAGAKLPSSRMLASDIGVSRNTIEEAYGHLETEGFLVRRTGSGSFVSDTLLHARRVRGGMSSPTGRRAVSSRGKTMGAQRACIEPLTARPFVGIPAVEAFPLETWHRLIAKRARELTHENLLYGHPAGHPDLRQAIATYLCAARGVHCDANQVLVLSSSQQGLDLAARVLIDPGDDVWMEEPGYHGARAALQACGARTVPVNVDEHGLDVEEGKRIAPTARLAYVTPSHHYPLGITMSLERRLALLEWARRSGSWILEDDYDSEYRYCGRPLSSIQGLDTSERVIYIGTFTKVMFPSLRLAYIVVPRDLMETFVNARTQIDGHAAPFFQSVLADFMNEGHFGTHVRRMRSLYSARRDVFIEAAQRELGDMMTMGPTDGGLHAMGFLRFGNDRDAAARAGARDIHVQPLSRFYAGGHPRSGLVMGYAGLSPAVIRSALRTLGRAIRSA